ncbi:MAG: uracil-DNA glycosylase [Pseudomonadota bacterium]
MPDPRQALGGLVDNLSCRRRLGLPLVEGGPAQLERLLALATGAPLPAAPAPLDMQAPTLEALALALNDCRRCDLHQGRKRVVFGAGPADAALMIIGEAPGAQEDQAGLPFVGPAGQLLERMLAAVGLKRQEVYITNLVKCRPPKNRDPLPVEAATCRPFLEAQVTALAPRVILALGRPACQALLASDAPIGALRGAWRQFMGIPLMPTFHPAYLLREPARKAEAYRDLKELAKALRD